MRLLKFQDRFLEKVASAEVDTAALSIPRGNGKSATAGYLGARVMTPTDPLFRPGTESIIIAASLEQGRIVYRFVREMIGQNHPDYRFSDSLTRVQIVHKPTKTALQVRSSNAKAAMGLVMTPYVILDEPGSWEVNAGTLMYDAIQTAQGKPGSPLTAIYIGTLAPARGGWWHDMITKGSTGSTYVHLVQGDRERWSDLRHVYAVNPLSRISPEFRKKLKEERDAALRDSRLKARFLSYRLNLPTADESEMLLTVDDWKMATARPVPPREGQPVVGVDLGGGRAWSAAVGMWENGRIEAMAVAPGIPDLEDQEKRDLVPSGVYRRLYDRGVLDVAEGLHVQPPGALWDSIKVRWGKPAGILCDRFRLGELQDAVQGSCPIAPWTMRWSEAGYAIRSLRKLARDGPLSVEKDSRPLLIASLGVAEVKNDDQGNTRLVKRGTNNTARDDVAAALMLVAGAFQREQEMQRPKVAEEEEVFIAR